LYLAEQNGPGRYDDDYHRWLMAEGLYDRIDLLDQERAYRQDAPDIYWDTVGALESNLDEAHHSTTWIGEQALAALQGWDESGNLLMVSFIKPHHPFDPPAPWTAMYDPQALTLLPGWFDGCLAPDLAYHSGYFRHQDLTESQVRRAMAYYYATISQIDDQVGRLIAHLKAQNLYDDTLILFTSDHGEFLGFHHLLLKGNYMYDPLIKVPLLIKFPQQARAGEVSTELVSGIDVGPTLIETAGCTIPASMAGQSLRQPNRRNIIFAESSGGRDYMVRTPHHKLLLCQNEAQSQFFDLTQDPFEMTNQLGNPAYQNEIDNLREALFHWLAFECRSPVNLNEGATVIDGPHVLTADQGHREPAKAYFRQKMASAYDYNI
jgi:arylsulfatase A-like enzyme